MRLPERLTRLPRHEEVASAAHCHVLAVVAASDGAERSGVVRRSGDAARHRAVERGIDGLLHRRLPRVSGVAGDVDGTLVGGHLRLSRSWKRLDKHGRSRQLGAEWHALPVVPSVGGVQEDGWLADDPPFLSGERDAVEAVVDVVAAGLGDVARLPRLSAVVRFEERLPGSEKESSLGLVGDERDVL